jgi:hypothetical protein
MTVTVKRRQRKEPKYYVYFNDWTGEIISIGNSLRPECPAPYIETTDEAAGDILHGEINEQKYIVSSDRHSEQRLIRKNDVLQLRRQEDSLFLLPNQKLQDWDVRAKLYLRNYKLVFEINQKKLKKFVSHSVDQEIKLNTRALFEFYVIRRDRPDFLVETFQIDAGSLIKYGVACVDMQHVLANVGLDDISILTRRYFEHYYLEVINDFYIETDQLEQSRSDNYWGSATQTGAGHIAFIQRDNIVTVRSLVLAEQLDDVGIHDRRMPFFIVTDSPDHYVGTFDVDMSRLRIGQEMKFEVDFDIDDVNIMHRNANIKVIKRKEQ